MLLSEILYRNDAIELKYEHDRGEPIVLVVTPDYVASTRAEGSRPATLSELQNYILDHATELKDKAAECKAQGRTLQILK
jgi:hypothetical protein